MGQKRLLFQIVGIVVSALTPALPSMARGYEMADLEVLVKEKNTREFLAHAHDIRPSQRDKTWREMLSQMALLAISEAQNYRPIAHASFDQIQSIATWPALKSDDYFALKRSDFARAYFNDCFEKGEKDCLERARLYIATSSENPNFNLFLVKLINSKFQKPSAELQSFKAALVKQIANGEFSKEFCAREDIKAELSKLALSEAMTQLRQNSKAPALSLNPLGSPACLMEMAQGLKLDPINDQMQTLAATYLIRRTFNILTLPERDYFLTYYLLSGPREGEIFNLAWNNLKSLGADVSRRQSVLQALKKHTRLPDESFGATDVRLRRTLTEAFLTYFPEYTDYYIKECHNYLAGLSEYPRGNPTRYCDDLILISKMKGSISDEVYLKHSALKKFRPIK